MITPPQHGEGQTSGRGAPRPSADDAAAGAIAARRVGDQLLRSSVPTQLVERWFPVLLVLPMVALMLLLSVYPVVQLIPLSLSTFSFSEGALQQSFGGLANVRKLLDDRDLVTILLNTLTFVVASVIIEFLLALGLALAVNREGRWASVLKALFTLPILIPPIVIGTVWRLMYNPNIGIINQTLRTLHLPVQNWLADGRYALWAVIGVDVWHWTSFVFLILLAGLQTIPREPLEAAEVDGASRWQSFRYVTLPLLKQTIFVAILFRTVFAFKVFDEVFLLTSGGPGNATEVLSLYIHRVEFKFNDLAYGALLSLLTIVLVLITLLISRRAVQVGEAAR